MREVQFLEKIEIKKEPPQPLARFPLHEWSKSNKRPFSTSEI